MLKILAAILVALCTVPGMLLRYAPFASIITTAKKRTLAAAYAAANTINLLVLAAVLHFWWMEGVFTYLRFGCILYSAVMTLINIFIIQERTREHLFVFGVVITLHYLILSIPNYVVSFLPVDSATMDIFTDSRAGVGASCHGRLELSAAEDFSLPVHWEPLQR